MYKKTIIKPNTYYDSVTLMSLGSKIKAVEGVKEAVVVMATDMNKEILMNVGLGNDETEGATQNDLIIAVEARDEETCVEAHRMILDKLTKGSGAAGQEAEVEYKTIRHAVKDNRAANVAVISVPGRYAAREAKIALNSGLHVMMFSDNVSIKEERALKERLLQRKMTGGSTREEAEAFYQTGDGVNVRRTLQGSGPADFSMCMEADGSFSLC